LWRTILFLEGHNEIGNNVAAVDHHFIEYFIRLWRLPWSSHT
jgi:hypothetical protein